MLIFVRHGKERKNHRDDKDVINRERFFDRKAGEVIHARLSAEREPDASAVKKAQTNIENGKDQTVAHRDDAVFSVEYTEIKRQQEKYKTRKAQPHP